MTDTNTCVLGNISYGVFGLAKYPDTINLSTKSCFVNAYSKALLLGMKDLDSYPNIENVFGHQSRLLYHMIWVKSVRKCVPFDKT